MVIKPSPRPYAFCDARGNEQSLVPVGWTFHVFGNLGIVLDAASRFVDAIDIAAWQPEAEKLNQMRRPRRVWTEEQKRAMSETTKRLAKKRSEDARTRWP